MATNDFLTFANSGSANVLTQAQYAALTSLLQSGFSSGVAQSIQVNKVLRQSSIMAAVLGQFIANTTGQNATDDGTTATLLANLTAAVSATSPVVVGSARNLAMSVTAASATATLTADQIVVASALNGQTYILPSFSKTINLATTGAGGMDAGAAPVSGFVAIYAIYNPTTGTAALLATNCTTIVASSVYGGANMPAGYTASALVSVWPTNASSQFLVGSQYDRRVNFVSTSALNGAGTVAGATSFSFSAIVPKNAKFVSGGLSITVNAAAVASITIYTQIAAGASSVVAANNSSGASGASSNFSNLPVLTAQTLWYSTTTSAGSITNYNMSVNQYEF